MIPNQQFIGSKNEEKLSWADLQLYMLKKIFDSRAEGNSSDYKSSVNSLELVLKGHQDDIYTTDIMLLKKRIKPVRESEGTPIADLLLFDGKLEALTELIYRVNRGIQRVRERLENCQLVKEVAKNLSKGIGQNLFVTGQPGQGKSNTCMALALEIMKLTGNSFTVRNIVFSSLKFTELYNNKKRTPRGGFIIYDEAGVGNNSKNSQKDLQKRFNQMLQTIRKRNILVIFNAPDLGFLDKDARKLLHFWIKTESHNLDRGEITVSPFVVELDQRTGNILYPYPVYNNVQLTKIIVPYVPEKYFKAYEKIETQYKDDLGLETELFLRKNKSSDIQQFRAFIKYRERGNTIKDTCDKMKIHRNTGTKLENMRRNAQYAHATL